MPFGRLAKGRRALKPRVSKGRRRVAAKGKAARPGAKTTKAKMSELGKGKGLRPGAKVKKATGRRRKMK